MITEISKMQQGKSSSERQPSRRPEDKPPNHLSQKDKNQGHLKQMREI